MSDPEASGVGTTDDPLRRFVLLRDRLADGGWSEGADRELAGLMEAAVRMAADALPREAAVLAIGGFGRGSLALRSDVDLLVLVPTPVEEPPEAFDRVRDAGVRVACAVHTPQSARALAGSRLDAISLFLTARLVAGNGEVFDAFRSRFALLLDREYGRIVDGMAREEARRRTEDPYRARAVDLKSGRGGLRTLDMLDWRRRIRAVVGLPAGEVPEQERAARAALTALRSGLHAVAGEAAERLEPSRLGLLARWLETDPSGVAARQRTVARTAESLVDGSWPEVARILAGGDRRPVPEPDHPVLVAAVRFVRRPDRSPPPPPGAVERWTGADRSAFLALLERRHRPLFDMLLASGWVAEAMPELDRLFTAGPAAAPSHRWSPGGHTLAVLDALEDMEGRGAAPAVRMPADPELLRWAALLHDVGVPEGGGPGHAERSAEPAHRIARRVGLDPTAADSLRRMVRHHGVLARLALDRRYEDAEAVTGAAAHIGDLETLRALHRLAVADLRGSGAPVARFEERVRRAYRAVERVLWRAPRPVA